jgi:hypothetical protein
MTITEVKGDLFSSNETLAHCVSKDFKMGAGIAVLFKQKFGIVDTKNRIGKDVGDIVVIDRNTDNNRYIIHMITKEYYYGKPTYGSLKSCLLKLYEACKNLNIAKLSIPKIGCGLDKLEWHKVKKILEVIFLDVDVDVYLI